MESVESLRGFRRRWRVILAAVVISMAVAFFTATALPASQNAAEQFEASILLLDARGSGFGVESRGTQGVSLDTIAIFTTLDAVAERAAKRLHTDQEPNALTESIDASADTETSILTITATTPRGPRAERVAKAFALSLIDYLHDQKLGDLRAQIRVLERELDELPPNDDRGSTTRASLVSQISTLKVQLATPLGLQVLDTTAAVAVDSTGFTAPSSTGVRVAIGAVLGLLGGIALALVLERFDRRITTWRIAEDLLPFPLLAEIPKTRRSRGFAVVDRPTSRGADAFRLLASSTLHALEQARIGAIGGQRTRRRSPEPPCSRSRARFARKARA